MTTKQTDAQVKAQLIRHINAVKGAAIYYGFDYPTNPNLENQTVENLQEFFEELGKYIDKSIRQEMRKLIR